MKFFILALGFFAVCFADQQVLYLEGSAYERGLQHGRALKEQIHDNIGTYIDSASTSPNPRVQQFMQNLPLKHIPKHLMDEMRGISEGAGVSFQKILMLNLFPEMFHCLGITAGKEVTQDHKLYHVRVLDYGIGKSLQNSAVLIVAKPNDGYAYVNVTYAGFVGSITGMNEKHISIGEIGGDGYGDWDGIPMAFLLREVLTNAATLEEAKTILSSAKRTCEYYYIISDGNDDRACGVYATSSQIYFFDPGSSYALFNLHAAPNTHGDTGRDDKYVFSPHIKSCSAQIQIHDGQNLVGLIHSQPKDCLTLTGFGYPNRYPTLVERIHDNYGALTVEDLKKCICDPVGRPTNLHNAIFCPSTLDVWISHAGKGNAPAYSQPYEHFNLDQLLSSN